MRFERIITFLVLLAFSQCSQTPAFDPFPGENWSTGYLKGADPDKSLFYYFFRCRNKTNVPLVVWLEGGPSYSSAIGIYMHSGPYTINNQTKEIIRNPYAWNNLVDLLFIDQPAGTLFSESKNYSKSCRDMKCVSEDLYAFLGQFYEMYPEYYERDLYIAGISYGGHYVPSFAKRISEGDPKYRLKGVIVFNGFYDFDKQVPLNAEFLHKKGIIDDRTLGILSGFYDLCRRFADNKVPVLYEFCGQTDLLVYEALNLPYDPYDIEAPAGPDIYETTLVKYLNRQDVQDALGVSQRFSKYNWTVYYFMLRDMLDSSVPELSYLVQKNYKVYSIFGDTDYMCSAWGGLRVADSIEWDGQEKFVNQPFVEWKMDGTTLGRYKEYKNLKHGEVHHVGHSIFYKQRPFGLEILKEFIGIE